MARAGIAQVGRDTIPARGMLEKIGFKYHDRIDPFDGGPHMEAITDDIELVRDTRRVEARGGLTFDGAELMCFASTDRRNEGDGMFRAVMTPCKIEGERVLLGDETMRVLKATDGDEIGFTPMPNEPLFIPKAGSAVAPTTKETVKKVTA